MKPVEIVSNFNECINRRDLETLKRWMTDDHLFRDPGNHTIRGKESCANAWQGFFQAFPDYRNVFQDFHERGATIVVTGYSTCSYPPLDGPAIWVARIVDNKVAEWKIYEDNVANRQHLGLG